MRTNSILNKTVFELQEMVAAENNTAAFEQLYLMFYKDLHQFAYRIIKSHHIAEEIVSDVFVQLWKNKLALDKVNNLKVYLYVAVKNLALTYLYKAKKYRVSWIEEFAGGPELPSTTTNAQDLLQAKDLSEKLSKAINNLPVKCKAVFKLVKEDGLKYHEAAKLLNLSIKTIENQMGIALKKISSTLSPASYRA
ncbi:MAG: RNA polymerase sigma-70 factor [Ferruginibacter sp.]